MDRIIFKVPRGESDSFTEFFLDFVKEKDPLSNFLNDSVAIISKQDKEYGPFFKYPIKIFNSLVFNSNLLLKDYEKKSVETVIYLNEGFKVKRSNLFFITYKVKVVFPMCKRFIRIVEKDIGGDLIKKESNSFIFEFEKTLDRNWKMISFPEKLNDSFFNFEILND